MYKTRVYYRDTDAGGVVYYGNYLQYFEAARTEFLLEKGVDLKDWVDRGIHFMVIRAEVDYLSPARYGEILVVETECCSVSGARFDMVNRALTGTDQRTVAVGKTRLGCIGVKGKPVRIPLEIREVLMALVNQTG